MIGTALGGLGSFFANRKAGEVSQEAASRYNMAMQQILAKQQANVDTHIAPDMYRDHMQGSDIQSTLGMVRDQIKRQQDSVHGGVTSRGGTAEATIAASGQGMNQYADIINRLYSHADTYKRQARDRYMSALQGLMGLEGDIASTQYQQGQGIAEGWAQWGQNAVTAGTGIDQSMQKLAASLIGG